MAVACFLAILVAVGQYVYAGEVARAGPLSMKQQHETMTALGREWARAKNAVKKRDFGAAVQTVMFIEQKIAPDVEKIRPHRNAQRRDEFLKYSRQMVADLARLRQAVSDHAPDAAELLNVVDENCQRCHAMFAGGHSG